ncbi:General alpha-glucoside permease [Ilyonectria robusta]
MADTVEDTKDAVSHVEETCRAEDVTPLQAIKGSPIAILSCIGAAIGPLMYGFDMVIVGACISMPAFQFEYGTHLADNTFIIPALWQSLWNSLIQLGIIIGAMLNSAFQDRFGRRWGFRSGGFIAAVGVTVMYISDIPDSVDTRRSIFLVGKIILGAAMGQLNSTCQTYVSEVAPPKLRGPLLSIFTFAMVTGQVIAISSVNARILIFTPIAYKVIIASQWAWCGALFLLSFIIPESPFWLVSLNRQDRARTMYNRLNSSRVNRVAGFAAIKETLDHESQSQNATGQASIAECFRGTNTRRTIIVASTFWLQQFLGVTLLANGPYFLQMAGMNFVKSLEISQVGISLALPATVISWWTMTRFGRRTILLWSIVSVGLLWFSVGIAGVWPTNTTALMYIGVMMQIITFFFGLGGGSATPVIAAEISSARLRALSQAVTFVNAAFSSWLFNFVVPYMFNSDQGNLGGLCGFIFGGLCVIGFIFSYFCIPETKGRSIAEVDEMFESQVATRKFATYICPQQYQEAQHKSLQEA